MIVRLLAARISRLIFPVVLQFFSLQLSAQAYIGLREIINYEKQQYSAGTQNWDIRQDAMGIVYFANNEGLLSFDGTYWKLYPLPNKTIVRSIEFGKDKRIYIGAQDEIGYFSPDESGKLVYTSLKNLLPEPDQKFADIWNLVSYGNDIFFRSNNKIFRYRDNRMTVYKPATAWMFAGQANDQLLAQDEQKGLVVFKNDNWETLIEKSLLPAGFGITSISSFNNDSCLITTHKNGLYVLSGNKLHPFRLSGMQIDPRQNFSVAAKIDEESFIVGTYTNGFYLINKEGVVIENFSKKEGLQNSNVRCLFRDRNHNIWLGLDSGIDFIAFDNAIKHINPAAINDGAGYAVAVYKNNLYFGLSNGIYQLPLGDSKDLSYAKNNLRLIKEGQTWGLYTVNDNLLAGTDEGFFQIKNDSALPVSNTTGFWVYNSLQNLHSSSMIIAGTYHGVRLFETKDHNFYDRGNISSFTESARFLVVDNDNIIWVSHPYRGVYRIQLSAGNEYVVKLYTAENGLPSSLNNHVYKIKNRIVIATEKGIYEYNSLTGAFEVSAYFKEIFGERSVRYLKEDPSGNIWFVQDKNIGVADFSTLKPSIIYFPELKGKILSGFEHIYPVNDNNIFVGGEKGFYHINFEKYKQHNHPLNVYIRTVKAIAKKDSLLFGGYFGNVNEINNQPDNIIPAISHRWNSFHIEYSSPLFEEQPNIEYSFYLEGFDKDWYEWSKKTEKDYTNLPAGPYTFKVKARNNFRNESAVSSYSFSVLPPWYQTTQAYIFYFLLAVYFIYLVYSRQQKKLLLVRRKHEEEQKRTVYLHQLELEKAEKEVVKLRNEKLETEIEFKNSELASTAMHLVQKEEFLTKVKEELQHLNKNGKDKTDPAELKKILRILSEEEKLNEEWEQFSIHFNNVHSNFLIKVKEKYPGLKPHELKLCAYLRMNLSSKEIAQLMSISVRGVEISRYRLRKKFEIPTETNLFQFLFDLQKDNF
ncbi:MAG TPA: triple tyrosine motif-containing protein [Chitinophagaceae bacterium]|nr:triple tyrosine motif-containing protein [Chitinophagaceae bacterium]